MTIVTTNEPEFSFGKGRGGWLIDTAIKIGTAISEYYTDVPVKYAELPPLGSAISLQKQKKRTFFYDAAETYTKLQKYNYRRTRFKGRRNKYSSYPVCRCGQLHRPKRRQQRSSYRSKRYVVRRSNGFYKSSRY